MEPDNESGDIEVFLVGSCVLAAESFIYGISAEAILLAFSLSHNGRKKHERWSRCLALVKYVYTRWTQHATIRHPQEGYMYQADT